MENKDSCKSQAPIIKDNEKKNSSILQYWRKRILQYTIISTAVLGFIAYVPSVILAIKHRLWWVVIIDTAALVWVFFILVSHRISYRFRTIGLLMAFFFLGFFLIIELGPIGAGYSWLFAFSVMTSVLLGIKPALISLLMNSIVLIITGILAEREIINWMMKYTISNLLIININFIALNIISAISISVLVDGIEKTIEKEQSIKAALIDEQKKLRLSNKLQKKEAKEKLKAEEALRENEAIYRSIVENSHDGIIIIDNNYRFYYANDQFCNITGRQREELIGSKFRLVLDEQSATLVEEHYRRRQNGETVPTRYEFNILKKNGEKRRVEISASVIIDFKGNSKNLGQLLDITERIQHREEKEKLEEQLRQAHKMEAIGTLAGGIAHDFNNILGAILGYAQLAQLSSPENENVQKYIEQLCMASERAKKLVQQILAFSRQSKSEKIPVDIGLIIKEALKLLRASIPSTIEIKQHIKSNSYTVVADQTQIHQVIMNLCTNAFHAMENEEGGLLEINLAPFIITNNDNAAYQKIKPGSYLKLTITDTGSGIEPEIIHRIFDPYFTTMETGKGTGMGLAMVHGIVKEHGGDISLISKPGKGTTFTILLPVVKTIIEKKDIKSKLIPGGNEQILLVDDEQILLDVGKAILEKSGYKVKVSLKPLDALEIFRSQPEKFDLVISDMTMPKLPGDKLVKELKKIRPEIPIILCTGFNKKITHEKAREMGISALLIKPVSWDVLSKTARRVLDGERF